MSKVLGPRSPVLGPRCQVPGPSTQVPGSEPRSQVPVPSPSPWSQVYIYHVPALRAQFPCPTSQFPGPKARGPGPSSHIPRLRSESQGWDPDPKFLFPGRKFQVPNPRYQVEDPCPRSQALGRSHFTSLIFLPTMYNYFNALCRLVQFLDASFISGCMASTGDQVYRLFASLYFNSDPFIER